MTDVGLTIEPKSDQLNADDLIAGPRTIKVRGVKGIPDAKEQPIAIYFEGDNGKPYKPCKSMRRVLVYVWGRNGDDYVGRRMTLYCDPEVKFGGIKVGGIRISHMDNLDEPRSLALTVTKGQRKPYLVKPLPPVSPLSGGETNGAGPLKSSAPSSNAPPSDGFPDDAFPGDLPAPFSVPGDTADKAEWKAYAKQVRQALEAAPTTAAMRDVAQANAAGLARCSAPMRAWITEPMGGA